MEMKKRGKQVIAWLMLLALCILPVAQTGGVAQAEETDSGESSVTLKSPVIDAEKGEVVWDCVYFGNYWQSAYITQPGNRPTEGQDDVEHEDTDGTKYIVRADKKCYKYEPIKWRVLSVSEDGKNAFLIADKCLDARPYHTEESEKETVTWENSTLRTWLKETFMETAFPKDEEQEAIILTPIENHRSTYYPEGAEVAEDDGESTWDDIYLLSIDEALKREYGFVDNFNSSEGEFSGTDTRKAGSTDFAKSCEDGILSEGYLLRTLGAIKEYVLSTNSYGSIPTTTLLGTHVNDKGHGIRPVLHLDLTKTDVWTYAGQVKQSGTEIAPDATPAVPTQAPTNPPGVTMAPGQVYPKNPVVYKEDLKKNTWDCIYFGKYYNTKITPSVLAQAGDHDTEQTDENGGRYLVRHEEGYFQYEPIKWRVLSINENGTDAFLIADEVVDIAPYFNERDVEITWEKSDIRGWLKDTFMEKAFTDEEKEKILLSQVTTPDNKWSGKPGGNPTEDKIYLPSIEEMLEPVYGFSADEKEGVTRKITTTDYAKAEGELDNLLGDKDAGVYWLRSSGERDGYPATVIYFGDGEIPKNSDHKSTKECGVRPVMHVDLTDTTLWTYAGQVTPEGVVVPKTEKPTVSQPEGPAQNPDSSVQLAQKPDATVQPAVPTQEPQTAETEVKKPGKPGIKKLKNKSGKKVTITLTKKISGAAGYQVAYATKSSMKGQKKKSFSGTSVTIKGLKKKKTYYFRVRAYAKTNGKTVYGNWSKTKSIKVKK